VPRALSHELPTVEERTKMDFYKEGLYGPRHEGAIWARYDRCMTGAIWARHDRGVAEDVWTRHDRGMAGAT
jgi:hypothetical protein